MWHGFRDLALENREKLVICNHLGHGYGRKKEVARPSLYWQITNQSKYDSTYHMNQRTFIENDIIFIPHVFDSFI